jgi:hypothetical protein
MNYQDVLTLLFRTTGYRTYLELGIGDGSMMRRIHPFAALTVAVDIRMPPLPPGVRLCEMTTQEFFRQPESRGPFDLIFIDADHAHEAVRSDLWSALEVLAPDGTIALHDTDPNERRLLHPTYCNDAYRIVEDLAARDDLTAVTLPVGPEGLTLVRRRNARRVSRVLSESPGAAP